MSYTKKVGVAYNINAINNLATRQGIKPLTMEQFKSMSRREINDYLRMAAKTQRINRRDVRVGSKTFRKNARAIESANLKQARLMHGTIRQGLAELGTIGTELIGGGIGSKIAANAITQNTNGGTQDDLPSVTPGGTENGPVAKRYSYNGRDED